MLSEHGIVLVLGRALQAPEVMLDDAVQARPGRLCLRRLRGTPKVVIPARIGHALRDGGCRLPLDKIKSAPPL